MSKSLLKIARVTLLMVVAGAVVTSCGRKGDLDKPSTPLEQQNIRKPGNPGTRKADPVPEKPFLLDPLL
ncbi:LPS translocon maturation chaperone LptM [Neorhizobium alkalisoli]|jgi:predicted small lipoprotein YifL|uniref:Lipoprotein n=1 Tax=Neorhizobium alkalisoli TaxID=528178 RepID=A0A561QJ02_9HYPH|nr:lipoprotein [Neorhizobium alkalisoli]TWF50348.1 hypothetical protein FHW37_106311 [Neorhizobium alkalisoli]